MLVKRTSFILILSLVMFFSHTGKLTAQTEEIDTSSYIPLFYNGSLDYNLMIASSMGYASEINRLIKLGADIEAETQEGVTPLIFAVASNHTDAVKALLSYNPNLDKITSDSETPLIIAVFNGNQEIAEALIRAGADIDLADKYGATALHYASIYGNFYMVDMLLYYYATVDIKSRDGTTPLMASILAGYADIADLLIQNGANMEARDNDGYTPFLIASQNGDTLIMNMLIKKGVDIYETNKYNYDALAITIMSDHKEATEFLLEQGDGWSSGNRNAISPYVVAAKYRRYETIEILEQYDIQGKYKLEFDEAALLISAKFDSKDLFAGVGFALREPYLNGGIIAGCDTKLWYSRLVIKENEELYYQYMDKRSVIYAGLFKDFSLTDRQFKGNLSFTVSLYAAYTFGNKFKGTNLAPENKLKLIPAVSLNWTKNSINVFCGTEYMKTEYFRVGPMWARIGFSYSLLFNRERSPGKIIRWY
jgi:ankyrin repeat protein